MKATVLQNTCHNYNLIHDSSSSNMQVRTKSQEFSGKILSASLSNTSISSTTVTSGDKQFCPIRYLVKCGWKYHLFATWKNYAQDVYAGIFNIFRSQSNFTVSSPNPSVSHRPVAKHTHFAWFMWCFPYFAVSMLGTGNTTSLFSTS